MLEVVLLDNSPVQNRDKCSDLVSLASSSSFIFTVKSWPRKHVCARQSEESILCLGPLSQGTEGQAFEFGCLVPSPSTSSTRRGSGLQPPGTDRPKAWIIALPSHSAVWCHLDFLVPRGAGALFQVGQGSAASTGGCRALHISSHLTTTSLSDSKGRNKGAQQVDKEIWSYIVHCSCMDLTEHCSWCLHILGMCLSYK